MLAEKLHEPKRRKQGFQRLSVESALLFVHYFNPNLGKLSSFQKPNILGSGSP